MPRPKKMIKEFTHKVNFDARRETWKAFTELSESVRGLNASNHLRLMISREVEAMIASADRVEKRLGQTKAV